MACRAVSSWKAFSRYDEGCRIRSKIEKKLSKYIESQERAFVKVIVSGSNDSEYDCQDEEAADLNRFPANGVNGSYSHPLHES